MIKKIISKWNEKEYFNYVYLIKLFILILSVIFFIWNITRHFWTLPAPSDALQYLGSCAWGSTYGFWPWLDRITLAIGLRLFTLLPLKIYVAGPIYIIFISTSILILSMYIAYRYSGFLAAFFVSILLNTSYMILVYSTAIYPNQTLAFYALISFILFFLVKPTDKIFNSIFFAGFFTAFVVFSKVTGLAVILFYLIYIVKIKNSEFLKKFIYGIILGSIIVLILYTISYNYQSLLKTIEGFFAKNIKGNIAGTGAKNLVSYLNILLSISYFPVFISIFISLGIYKKKELRNLYFFGWSFILLIYFIYIFSSRGGSVIPLYIYSPFIFFAIGLAIYLADIVKQNKNNSIFKRLFKIIRIEYCEILFYFILFSIMVISFKIGYTNAASFGNYYSGVSKKIPFILRFIFIVSPILIVSLLSFMEYSRDNVKSMLSVISLFTIVTLWCSMYNGGMIYNKIKSISPEMGTQFYYDNASLLNEVPSKTFSIFIKKWEKKPKAERILWVYRLFFDEKYTRGNNYDSQLLNKREIDKNIRYLNNKNEIIKAGNYPILTDSPDIIKIYHPKATIIKEINWKDSIYFLLNLS